MRRLLLIVLLLVAPACLLAQKHTNPPSAAHGSDTAAHDPAKGGEEHGGGHEKTYFGIPGWILKLINMVAFFAVLGWMIGGPVKKALATRHETIRTEAEEARARRAKADQLAADIQARLSQIESDVRAIHDRAIAEGERQKRELTAAAEAEAQKILQSARNEVDNRLKRARHELTEYAGELAAQRAEQILREKINDEDRHNLFAESVRQIGEVES